MRPVTRLSNPPTYAPPPTLYFTGANAAKVIAVLGTNNPTLVACLGVWLRVLKAGKLRPKWYAAWAEMAKLVQGRVEKIYKEAGADLIDGLGEYCSYCESRIAGLLEVEHVAPKAQYPTLATDWDNLLLACGACNICKSDLPSRAMVRRWMAARISNENQCRAQIRGRYLWP